MYIIKMITVKTGIYGLLATVLIFSTIYYFTQTDKKKIAKTKKMKVSKPYVEGINKVTVTTEPKNIPNNTLISPNGLYRLDQQQDGNLVIYRTSDNKAIWDSYSISGGESSETFSGWASCSQETSCKYSLVLQPDANLVTYTDKPNRLNINVTWGASIYQGTNFSKGTGAPYTLKMQNNGNLVIYDKDNKPTWYSNSIDIKEHVKGRYITLKRIDGANTPFNISRFYAFDSNNNQIELNTITPSAGPAVLNEPKYGPKYLNDPIESMSFGDTNFTHTTGTPDDFIKLDLGTDKELGKIRIINRQNCCQDRISGSVLEIKNDSGKIVYSTILNSIPESTSIPDLNINYIHDFITTKPVELEEENPVVQPEENPVVQPEENPVVQPEENPVVQPEENPVFQPEENPVVQPEENPVVQPEENPVVQPEENPVVQPEENPVGQPEENTVVQPEENPVVITKNNNVIYMIAGILVIVSIGGIAYKMKK